VQGIIISCCCYCRYIAYLQGQASIPAQRSSSRGPGVKNSIHFKVTWSSRSGKAKSFYMRKPPHYLVYQLTLDIEAHTGIKADTQVLALYGTELQPFQRLSSCGVTQGDIVVLTQRPASQQVVNTFELQSKRAEQLLGRLMSKGSALGAVPEDDE
jgi:hypothetical protein